ncbi:hypothetical protein [Aeoliella sp. SH292]|uniref:hypothetical protein n=1 Tax=Aeoliella sp. SH292 TaxID=3454464 RepID=UPI003F995D52
MTKHYADADCLDAFATANSQRCPLDALNGLNLVDTDLYPSHQDACSSVPNCTGWWRFSSIGYNASRSQAILHEDYDHPKWGLMGMGHFVLLEQSQQQWRVVAKHMTWMS